MAERKAKHEWVEALPWWRFYLRMLREVVKHSWGWTDWAATFFGIVVPLYIHYHPRAEASMTRLAWEIPIGIFAFLGTIRLISAPYLLYRDHHQAWDARESDLTLELTKFRTVAPSIDIDVSMLIPQGKLGERPTGIFACLTLTLREPSEVVITSFELEAALNDVKLSSRAIDDMADWVRLRKLIRSFEPVVMPSITMLLTQRGHPVEGWVHFSFDLLDSEIQKAELNLILNTKHGSCCKPIHGVIAWHEPDRKGTVIRADTPFLGIVPVNYA